MAKRTGVPSLIRITAILCRLITKFETVIKTQYPSNTALHVALEAALVACAALAVELENVREYGD